MISFFLMAEKNPIVYMYHIFFFLLSTNQLKKYSIVPFPSLFLTLLNRSAVTQWNKCLGKRIQSPLAAYREVVYLGPTLDLVQLLENSPQWSGTWLHPVCSPATNKKRVAVCPQPSGASTLLLPLARDQILQGWPAHSLATHVFGRTAVLLGEKWSYGRQDLHFPGDEVCLRLSGTLVPLPSTYMWPENIFFNIPSSSSCRYPHGFVNGS